MGRRTWIKLYCDKWLTGTLRDDTEGLRGIWADVLALAGSGNYGDDGIIQVAKGVGYTDQQIAAMLQVKPESWQKYKKRLIETERIQVNGSNSIAIIKWRNYQSEYHRQKTYRLEDKKAI